MKKFNSRLFRKKRSTKTRPRTQDELKNSLLALAEHTPKPVDNEASYIKFEKAWNVKKARKRKLKLKQKKSYSKSTKRRKFKKNHKTPPKSLTNRLSYSYRKFDLSGDGYYMPPDSNKKFGLSHFGKFSKNKKNMKIVNMMESPFKLVKTHNSLLKKSNNKKKTLIKKSEEAIQQMVGTELDTGGSLMNTTTSNSVYMKFHTWDKTVKKKQKNLMRRLKLTRDKKMRTRQLIRFKKRDKGAQMEKIFGESKKLFEIKESYLIRQPARQSERMMEKKLRRLKMANLDSKKVNFFYFEKSLNDRLKSKESLKNKRPQSLRLKDNRMRYHDFCRQRNSLRMNESDVDSGRMSKFKLKWGNQGCDDVRISSNSQNILNVLKDEQRLERERCTMFRGGSGVRRNRSVVGRRSKEIFDKRKKAKNELDLFRRKLNRSVA